MNLLRRVGKISCRKKAWYDAIDEAEDAIRNDAEIHIQGYDIDDEVLKMARANAKLAGVDEYIHFQRVMWLILIHRKSMVL